MVNIANDTILSSLHHLQSKTLKKQKINKGHVKLTLATQIKGQNTDIFFSAMLEYHSHSCTCFSELL